MKIAIIGTGGIANWHAGRFTKMKGVSVVACCDIIPEKAKAFAEKWKIPRRYTDYRELLEKEDLDAVSVAAVDSAHAPVSLAAVEKGRAVLCEKPMAVTLADARKMRDAALKKGVPNMINFSYRNSSAVQAASKLIADGGIGRIIHIEASYLQSWLVQAAWGDWKTSSGWMWRLSRRHGSLGVLGDIGCHIYDMTSFLAGDFKSIACTLKVFDKGVPGNRSGEYVFDANDSFVSTVNFVNGGLGTVHSSRWASGHINSLRNRIFGDKGAIEIDLDTSYDQFRIARGAKALEKANWQVVKCKPTPDNFQRFADCVMKGKKDASDFVNGVKVQSYLHTSVLSDRFRKPVVVRF